MIRSLLLIAMLGIAAPACAEGLSEAYSQWEQLRDPDVSDISFEAGREFLSEHAGWPEEKTIRLRTEAAAMQERPDDKAMAKFCTDLPPISGRGMIACARAGVGDKAAQNAWITKAWVQGDFTEEEESRILQSYGNLLTHDYHTARMERLLYEGKASAAKRMMARVPAAKQNLYRVRLAFVEGDKRAPKLLDTLSSAQRRDTGILFERLRWRMKRGDDALAELVVAVPKDAPYPDAWWPMRARAAREAMDRKNYSLALDVLQHHGELKPEALSEALWLKGWILLRHRKEAGAAYKQFFKLYTAVTTPVSKARAAYWAARAAEANGNADIANEWLVKASKFPTVFYGQLAISKLTDHAPLPLPKAPAVSDADKQAFAANELATITRVLAKAGDEKRRDLFLTTLGMNAISKGQHVLLADMGQEIGGAAMGVEAAKLALRDGVVLIDAGWPKMKLPADLPIEPALTLAITRQESEFNPEARSSANAMGLMQLLPSTAKEVARRIDLAYEPKMITDPATNLTLGSNYLGQLVNGFDGSYILGIASYNAGPANVRKWIAARGMPPKKLDAAIDWIESIPFGETRNYVMRVLENVSVYRTIKNPEAPLAIEKDLVR
jgi:soluble lytic murein transglycosylase